MLKRSFKNAVRPDEKHAAERRAKNLSGRPAPKAEHLAMGACCEDIAADYLSKSGFEILGRNVRVGHYEIDIVAKEKSEIVFAEVRTRGEGWMMSAEESVGPKKIANLISAGRIWTQERGYGGFWRIDLLAITLSADGGEPLIEHLRDITEPIK